jgi:hypothetical protein
VLRKTRLLISAPALVQYLVDQSMIAEPMKVDDLFAPLFPGL